MTAERVAKVRRVGPASLAVVIPKDWCRGNEIEQGDDVLVRYDGEVHINVLPKRAAPRTAPTGGTDSDGSVGGGSTA